MSNCARSKRSGPASPRGRKLPRLRALAVGAGFLALLAALVIWHDRAASLLFFWLPPWARHVAVLVAGAAVFVAAFRLLVVGRLPRLYELLQRRLGALSAGGLAEVRDADVARRRIVAVSLGSMLAAAALMTGYELIKQAFYPDITVWESHLFTIFFASLSALFIAYVAASFQASAVDSLLRAGSRYRGLFENSPGALLEADGALLRERLASPPAHGAAGGRRRAGAVPGARNLLELVRLTDANQQALRLLGAADKERLLQRGLAPFLLPASLPPLREALAGLTAGRRTLSGEITLRGRSEEPLELEFRLAALEAREQGWPLLLSLTDVGARKEAERELRRSNEELRRFAGHLQSVREEERSRIAREVHDDLGQKLTALKMDAFMLGRELPQADRQALERLGSILALADGAIQTVQRISTELHPSLLDSLFLSAAVEWEAGEFQSRTGIRTEVILDPAEIVLDRERSTTVFRIFQEAMTNVARHAQATQVQVLLRREPARVILRVSDNGVGIGAEEAAASDSMGLIGMRERCRIWEGSLELRAPEGGGTEVLLVIPLPEEAGQR